MVLGIILILLGLLGLMYLDKILQCDPYNKCKCHKNLCNTHKRSSRRNFTA